MRAASPPLLAGVAVAAVVGAITIALTSQREGARASLTAPVPVPRTQPGPIPAASTTGTGPRIALLMTRPGATTTSLYLPRAGNSAPGEPVATFNHLEDAAVRGAVLPDSDVVLAAADTTATRDGSFAASLFRLAPRHPPALLVDRVVHASRPLVTAAGRVFVSRGKPGPEVGGAARIDDLTLDEIDPATGAAHTVHARSGYLLQLAGAFGRELVVYRVSAAGTDVVAVDPDSGAVRSVVPRLLPYARDFSVDAAAGTLLFQERDEVDTRAYTLERVDLVSGREKRLYTSTSPSLAPFAWPGGGVAYSHEGRDGLALLGGTRPLIDGLLGPGVDLLQAVSMDAVWVAGVHTAPGRLPLPFAIDTRTGAATWLAARVDARAFVAGFVTGTGGGP